MAGLPSIVADIRPIAQRHAIDGAAKVNDGYFSFKKYLPLIYYWKMRSQSYR